MKRPLAGLRVLAVEQYGAGPYGTLLMSELGAEVVKIEVPATGGDTARATGPYFLGENDSLFFQTFSRGKKSLPLDLRNADDRARFERLVGVADVVVNNLRGSQPAKLRITYDDLKDHNPKIVCAHLSAYGRGNSREDWPGYDYLMQAEAGFTMMTGEPENPPTRFGLSMVDFMAGTMMAFGVVSAVLNARSTGEGSDVDVSLFDAALHQLTYCATWALNTDYIPERLPRGAHPSIAPSQIVRTRDGWGILMCQTPKMWQLFCELVGRDDLLTDPRFVDQAARRENRAELSDIVDEIMSVRDGEQWRTLFASRVPFSPILDVKQALENPFVAEVGMRDHVDHPATPDGLEMLACPIKIDGERMPAQRAPLLGEEGAEEIWGIA